MIFSANAEICRKSAKTLPWRLDALAKLRELLKPVPFVSLGVESKEPAHVAGNWRPDFSIDLQADDDAWVLIGEVKADGQPRHVRGAALQLRDYVQRFASADARARAYPVFVAPFISPASAEICKEAGVGFADLAGNCHLAFGRVYIEKSAAGESVPQAPRSAFTVRRQVGAGVAAAARRTPSRVACRADSRSRRK